MINRRRRLRRSMASSGVLFLGVGATGTLAAAVAVVVGTEEPADAVSCNTEAAIFEGLAGFGTFVATHGTANDIPNNVRPLDTQECGYNTELAGDTAHVEPNGFHGNLVEIIRGQS